MAKKKGGGGGGPKPGELPPTFADLITLLLTFFVLMMALASFDEHKLKDFFQAAGGNFGIGGSSGAGVLFGGASMNSNPSNLSAGNDTADNNSSEYFRSGAETPGRGDTPRVTQFPKENGGPIQVSQESVQQFQQLQQQLQQQQQGLQAEMTNQGLKITLQEEFSQFASGSAELPPAATQRLREVVASDLQSVIQQGYEIVVTGHTDNVPLGSGAKARFKDNRGLAAERANNVLRIFESVGVPPQQISAAGYGEHKPKADNATADGKSQNRRIEILVKYKEFSANDYSPEAQGGAPPAAAPTQ